MSLPLVLRWEYIIAPTNRAARETKQETRTMSSTESNAAREQAARETKQAAAEALGAGIVNRRRERLAELSPDQDPVQKAVDSFPARFYLEGHPTKNGPYSINPRRSYLADPSDPSSVRLILRTAAGLDFTRTTPEELRTQARSCAGYAWVIERDHLSGDDPTLIGFRDDVGTVGPRFAPFHTLEEIRSHSHAKPFRMLDADRNVYYEGWITGGDGFEPLEDFGAPNAGACTIQYKDPAQGGKWCDL